MNSREILHFVFHPQESQMKLKMNLSYFEIVFYRQIL